MATKKQKQELIDVLKFTPCVYTLTLYGYGGEAVLGTVDKKAYDYFVENDIDLEEYAHDWDNELAVPEESQPFTPGEWHDCDNLAHVNGVEMSDSCMLEVSDQNRNVVFQCSLSIEDLKNHGISVECCEETHIENQPPGSVVFFGQNFEKGSFFDGNIELKSVFDPKKFSIDYSDVNGWLVFNSIQYNGTEIYSDDYSTTGKSSTYEFHLVSGDGVSAETYSEPEIDENDISRGSDYTPTKSESITFPVSVNPVREGWYETVRSSHCSTIYGQSYWDGCRWVEFIYRKPYEITDVQTWTGINWDTSDWSNQPVKKPQKKKENAVAWPFSKHD